MSTVEAPELWDTAEIADYLRKNRKTVQNRVIYEPGFPEPLPGCGRPKLFFKHEVLAYFTRAGRQSRRH